MKRLIFLFVVGIYMFSFLNLALGDSYTSIHYTGFESGVDGWSDPGSDADRQLEGSGDEDPPSQCDDFGNCNDNGQYTFHIQDDSATSYTEQSFNFNSYDYIILNFWGYPSDWNGGEYVQINCDGNEIWRETQGDYSNEVWRFVSIMIYPDNCTFDSSVIIRFTGDPGLSGDGDDWVFDGINITGAMIEVGDIVYPNVASLLPLQGEGFNQSEEIEISANVSDDILVDSVYANITLPNGTINQIKLINHTLNKYNSSFMIPSIGGRYYFKIITNDSSNNINDTEESYFEVEDNLTFLNFVGYGYLDGERNNLFYEGNIGALVLDNSNEGNFTSQVFDAGSSVDWKNMSWVQDSAFSESKLIKPIYAESEFGVDITSQVESSDGTATWERVEVQAWNDSLSEGVIDSVIGYCEVEWIDAGAQIGFQISRNNGSSWDSEICVQDTVALTIFSCDLKANSGVDTIEEVNNLRMRCTFPTAGSGDYYSTDYVYVEINYSNSELNFQVRSDDDDSAWGDFIGPDGTSSSYYTNSSLSELNVSDNRYFQYKAFFSESNQLYNVSISYSDICTANITNTSWSEWGNLTCVLDEMNQTRFLTEYDSNNCGAANITIYDYQLVGPSLYNTTWSNWENITLCLPGDYYTQERNLTQYDAYSCKLNETISEQQNL
ncbi:MAG: hypothetical protein ABIE22_03820, partial [archaeon]